MTKEAKQDKTRSRDPDKGQISPIEVSLKTANKDQAVDAWHGERQDSIRPLKDPAHDVVFSQKAGLANDKISDNLEDWASCWHSCLSSYFILLVYAILRKPVKPGFFLSFLSSFSHDLALKSDDLSFFCLQETSFPLLLSIKK